MRAFMRSFHPVLALLVASVAHTGCSSLRYDMFASDAELERKAGIWVEARTKGVTPELESFVAGDFRGVALDGAKFSTQTIREFWDQWAQEYASSRLERFFVDATSSQVASTTGEIVWVGRDGSHRRSSWIATWRFRHQQWELWTSAEIPIERTAPFDRTAAEAEIHAGDRMWAESLATGETKELERIIADDFLGIDPYGEFYDKPTLLRDTPAMAKSFESCTLGEVQIRFLSTEVAVSQGDETWVKRDGTRGRFVWTDTWVHRDGRWQMVATQDLAAPVRP